MEDRIQEKDTPANKELNIHISQLKEQIKTYKKLDTDAKKVQERLTLIKKVALIGVWDWDIKLNHTLWDNKMYEIYGLTPKRHMTHSRWLACIHPDDLSFVKDSINQSFINPYKGHIEFRIIRPDGSIRNISAAAEMIKNKEGKIIRVIGVNKDITERKVAEEALKKSEQKLQIANTEKDKLFSILAHDLVSPFSSVLGFSKLLMYSCKERDFEKITEYANLINTATNQTYDLLTNLLEWSRSQRQKIQFQPGIINLDDIINRVIVLYSFALDEKEIYINKFIAKDFSLVADANMIYTIIRNLVSNAIKFTGEEGLIKITSNRYGNNAQICISDSGKGMSETSKDKLFNPEDNFTTEGTNKESGTGLGLLICKDFVERHGGKIWIESKENIGTEVYFTIPLNIQPMV